MRHLEEKVLCVIIISCAAMRYYGSDWDIFLVAYIVMALVATILMHLKNIT